MPGTRCQACRLSGPEPSTPMGSRLRAFNGLGFRGLGLGLLPPEKQSTVGVMLRAVYDHIVHSSI